MRREPDECGVAYADVQDLIGVVLTAAGPEAGAASAGEDEAIVVGFWHYVITTASGVWWRRGDRLRSAAGARCFRAVQT